MIPCTAYLYLCTSHLQGLHAVNLLFNSECLFLRVSRLADFTHPLGRAANACTVPYLKYRGHPLLAPDAGQYRLGTSYLLRVPVMRQMKGGLSPLHY